MTDVQATQTVDAGTVGGDDAWHRQCAVAVAVGDDVVGDAKAAAEQIAHGVNRAAAAAVGQHIIAQDVVFRVGILGYI